MAIQLGIIQEENYSTSYGYITCSSLLSQYHNCIVEKSNRSPAVQHILAYILTDSFLTYPSNYLKENWGLERIKNYQLITKDLLIDYYLNKPAQATPASVDNNNVFLSTFETSLGKQQENMQAIEDAVVKIEETNRNKIRKMQQQYFTLIQRCATFIFNEADKLALALFPNTQIENSESSSKQRDETLAVLEKWIVPSSKSISQEEETQDKISTASTASSSLEPQNLNNSSRFDKDIFFEHKERLDQVKQTLEAFISEQKQSLEKSFGSSSTPKDLSISSNADETVDVNKQIEELTDLAKRNCEDTINLFRELPEPLNTKVISNNALPPDADFLKR